LIVLNAVSKRYPGNSAWTVENVSFSVPMGKTLVLIGASGCGKTTLLKIVNRLIEPTCGTITIDGQDITQIERISLRRNMGYVAQNPTLFPHMTIRDNIGLPLYAAALSALEITQHVNRIMKLVELEDTAIASRYPDEISGGQQQRACLARALITSPTVLLLDEPFAALDAITRQQMQKEIRKIRSTTQVTILFVTHDIREALYLGDLIAVLHEGRIEQIGTGQELCTEPATPYVRSLVAFHA
jgi:osmoprotectant transport system ATP-binding protein